MGHRFKLNGVLFFYSRLEPPAYHALLTPSMNSSYL
jgi:hypothetical protein